VEAFCHLSGKILHEWQKIIKDRKLVADISFVTGENIPAIIKPKEG
jgi:hypothetical protein